MNIYSFISRKLKQALGYCSLRLGACNEKSPYPYVCEVHHKDYFHDAISFKLYFESLNECKNACEYLSKYNNTYCIISMR